MTTLSLEPPRRRSGGRILAIEADAQRARALRDLFRRREAIDLTIVRSVGDATASIDERTPDVVLTSVFLPPADVEALTRHLKMTPGAAHVQVLIAPELDGPAHERSERHRRARRLLARRAPTPVTTCDAAAVLNHIDNYLDRARQAMAEGSEIGAPDRAAERLRSRIRLVHTSTPQGADSISDIIKRVDQIAGPKGRDRRRSVRRPGAELPWLWSATTPSGIDLKVVDVSNGGVLVETATKLSLGSTIELRILGYETNMAVLARIARTEVAQVDGRGVKYHLGAAFARDLDLVRPEGVSPETTPALLADVLSRVLAQSDQGSTAALLCFEQELARLLPVRSIQLRHTPAPSADGRESVYFSVPGVPGSILQATFDRDLAPSPLEFRLLKAAANLAAVVMEFVPRQRELQPRIAAR